MSIEVLVLGFDCVPSFHSGEVVSRRARVQSQVERSEPEGNLDGFLARLHDSPQNEGKQTEPISEGTAGIAVNIIRSGRPRRDCYTHEKERLESSDRGRLYHLPFLFQPPDGRI